MRVMHIHTVRKSQKFWLNFKNKIIDNSIFNIKNGTN